jgi:hypothetical protein
MRKVVVIYAERGLYSPREISVDRQDMHDIQQSAGGFTAKSIDALTFTENATFYAFKPEGPYYNEMAWNAEHGEKPPHYADMAEVRCKIEKREQGNEH